MMGLKKKWENLLRKAENLNFADIPGGFCWIPWRDGKVNSWISQFVFVLLRIFWMLYNASLHMCNDKRTMRSWYLSIFLSVLQSSNRSEPDLVACFNLFPKYSFRAWPQVPLVLLPRCSPILFVPLLLHFLPTESFLVSWPVKMDEFFFVAVYDMAGNMFSYSWLVSLFIIVHNCFWFKTVILAGNWWFGWHAAFIR